MIKDAEDFKTFLTRMSEAFSALSSSLAAHGQDLASVQARSKGNECFSDALALEKGEGPVSISRSEMLKREEIVEELNRLRKIEKQAEARGIKEWSRKTK